MSTDQSRPDPTDRTEPTEPPAVRLDADQTIQITEARTTEFAAPPTDTPRTELPAALTDTPVVPPTVVPPTMAPQPAPLPAPVPPAAPDRPALRVGTVVWGLVLAVIGAGVIAVAAGARFDLELASIGLLALAGVGLLAGSIATSARRRTR